MFIPGKIFGVKNPTYRVGCTVEKDDFYVCVPCGYRKYLKQGTKFPDCLKCMGKRWFKKGLESWELHEN